MPDSIQFTPPFTLRKSLIDACLFKFEQIRRIADSSCACPLDRLARDPNVACLQTVLRSGCHSHGMPSRSSQHSHEQPTSQSQRPSMSHRRPPVQHHRSLEAMKSCALGALHAPIAASRRRQGGWLDRRAARFVQCSAPMTPPGRRGPWNQSPEQTGRRGTLRRWRGWLWSRIQPARAKKAAGC